MGRVCVLVLGAILPIAVAAVPAQRTDAAEPAAKPGANPAPAPAGLKLGLPESMFSGLPPAIVQVGSKPFKDMLEKETGLKGEVVVTKDYADSAAQLRNNKLDVAVFHGVEFAWVKQHPELVPLILAVPRTELRACLVVNAASKAVGPKDLKGNCVAIPAVTKAHCHLYLDRLKETLPVACCCPAKLDGKSVEDALDAVVGGNCECALVDAASLAVYKGLKPGAGDQLKVLAQSEPFPSAVVVYRKDVFNAKAAADLRDGLIKGIDTTQGKRLKDLWKLKGFAEVGPGYQTELDKILKAYPAPKQP